ncbi:MAG: DoxX family protein [Ekhidna sp.]
MNLNQQIGVLTVRLLLGLIFLFQGIGKVFKIGIENVYQGFFLGTYQELLPEFLLKATAYYTSYVELLAGFLVVIGLFRSYALYALASVLVIVSFGHGLVDPIWDLSHVMYRAILLVALLFLPAHWDRFSADEMLARIKP